MSKLALKVSEDRNALVCSAVVSALEIHPVRLPSRLGVHPSLVSEELREEQATLVAYLRNDVITLGMTKAVESSHYPHATVSSKRSQKLLTLHNFYKKMIQRFD